MPSVATTQRGSPITTNEEAQPAVLQESAPVEEAIMQTDTAIQPPPTDPTAIVPKLTVPTLVESARYTFCLKIIGIDASGGANYDPEEAVPFLNAALQDEMMTLTALTIPEDQYFVDFDKPPDQAPSNYHGHFNCTIPSPLKIFVPDLTAEGGKLTFTGDSKGNKYKLEFLTYIAPDVTDKQPRREKNQLYWFLLCPLNKKNGLSRRQVHDALVEHLASFGVTIQKHKDAFKPHMDKNREQWDGDWHVEYDIDWTKVPKNPRNGENDISKMKTMILDEATNQMAYLRFKEHQIRVVWGACFKCFKTLEAVTDGCTCMLVPQAAPTGKKPQTAAQKSTQAQARIAKKAKMNFTFNA